MPCSLALALISAPLLASGDQQIQGAIVDASGAAIGGTSVRLMNADSEEVARTKADDFGKFQLRIASSGSYVLKAWQHGLRSHRVPVAARPDGETIDLGTIRLDIAGCDEPGVICDWIGEPPPDPGVSRNYVSVQVNCMLSFTRGKAFCAGDEGERQSDADVRVARDENGVYLIAMNGAALSPPNLPNGNCADAHPKEVRIRLDGLGPGDDICLYTHDRHWSHVFVTEDVTRRSQRVAFWQITRKR